MDIAKQFRKKQESFNKYRFMVDIKINNIYSSVDTNNLAIILGVAEITCTFNTNLSYYMKIDDKFTGSLTI